MIHIFPLCAIDTLHYEKKGCFVIGLATQFLSYIGHLELTLFIRCECYGTSCKSCNSLYIRCNSLQFCCNNYFSTTMQLPYDNNHNVMLMSLFIHPSKLNMWHYKKIHDFFEILISIVHYDYLF